MEQKQIENYVKLEILKPMILESGEYRLKRPLKMTVQKKILDTLSDIYVSNAEKGGVLGFRPDGVGSLICELFTVVPNVSKLASSYEPNTFLFKSAIDEILKKNFLPVVIHTHPTNLGFESYDSKRVKFFLKSSAADRSLARLGVVPFLNMPECIYVKDGRLKGGFGLNFFVGGIFPQSISSLTSLQFGAVAVGSLAFTQNKAITALAVMAFGIDFLRKPKYNLDSGGNLIISLSA